MVIVKTKIKLKKGIISLYKFRPLYKVIWKPIDVTHEKPYFLFANVFKRWSFQKNPLEYDLSCIIIKDDIAFSQKYDLIL